MIRAVKVRLLPTKEQEILMFKSIGISRFAYNWGLAEKERIYKEENKSIHCRKIRNEFIKLKKLEEYKWLNDVSSSAIKQAFDDLQTAFNNFLNKTSKYPKFKSKRKSKQSFYVRHDRMNIKNNTANLEKIGRVKITTNYEIPIQDTYTNPRCSYDGKYWYLSFGFDQDENQVELNQELSIGIDLGITKLAVVNHLDKPIKNINKSKKVKRLKKKLKRLQRQISRKYEMNKDGTKFIKTSNIVKLEKKIKLIHRKLSNIRNNHIHQATNTIIKMRPYRVVMEDLNISGMMKNKHLSKAIQEQKFHEFIRQMKYKCEFNGIEFVRVDRFFPSSKKCSNCGTIKKDLNLRDRWYSCECGLEIDRDKNASINLGKYEVS